MSAVATKVAVDIGGTFTDVVCMHEQCVWCVKVPTIPQDITAGILNGLEATGVAVDGLMNFVHGTTIALNALLEGKTVPVGVITTRGFRDVLEIMRTNRPDLYDLQQEKPVPLAARRHRYEINERLSYNGERIQAIDPGEVEAIAAECSRAGITSVAICLLHSHTNDAHEREAATIISKTAPDLTVSISSDLSSRWGEFERTSTTVMNAAVRPLVSDYLTRLRDRLYRSGFAGKILIMQSNGGVMTGEEAERRPVATLMSGPIGGVTGAAAVAAELGGASLVSLDIGGTSADVAILERGQPLTRTVGEISGWALSVPMIDLTSIGSGGGSIARVDQFGRLSVGPQSAGASPGPASYGRGGTEATVTDAHVVLGRLDPTQRLGDLGVLDETAARTAIRDHVADRYGITCEEAAAGIVAVANSDMTRLLWEVVIGRGYDPREFSLLAFGGAGPLHACELARELTFREVIVPPDPGTFSAYGILSADVRHDFERMTVTPDGSPHTDAVATFRELTALATEQLASEGFLPQDIDVAYLAELRYVGQDHPISVDLDVADLAATTQLLTTAVRKFHARHERLYGFRRDDAAVELVRIQVSASGRGSKPRLSEPATAANPKTTPTRRRAYFNGTVGEVSVYARQNLPVGLVLNGPVVITEPTTTTYVPHGFKAEVLPHGSLRLWDDLKAGGVYE